jgi:hypothetical protein
MPTRSDRKRGWGRVAYVLGLTLALGVAGAGGVFVEGAGAEDCPAGSQPDGSGGCVGTGTPEEGQWAFDPGFAPAGQGTSVDPATLPRGSGNDPPAPPGSIPAGPTACWAISLNRSRGVYPYHRALNLYTTWCGQSWVITYRASTAWPSHDFLCRVTGGPNTTRVAGGAGWSFVDVQSSVSYGCHSPWWFDFNDTLMMRIRYHANGYYQTIAYQ